MEKALELESILCDFFLQKTPHHEAIKARVAFDVVDLPAYGAYEVRRAVTCGLACSPTAPGPLHTRPSRSPFPNCTRSPSVYTCTVGYGISISRGYRVGYFLVKTYWVYRSSNWQHWERSTPSLSQCCAVLYECDCYYSMLVSI